VRNVFLNILSTATEAADVLEEMTDCTDAYNNSLRILLRLDGPEGRLCATLFAALAGQAGQERRKKKRTHGRNNRFFAAENRLGMYLIEFFISG